MHRPLRSNLKEGRRDGGSERGTGLGGSQRPHQALGAQAVTEYVDHWRAEGLNGKPPSVSLNSIWFGEGQQRKLKAFNIACAWARGLARQA